MWNYIASPFQFKKIYAKDSSTFNKLGCILALDILATSHAVFHQWDGMEMRKKWENECEHYKGGNNT